MRKITKLNTWFWGFSYALQTNWRFTVGSSLLTSLVACLPALNVFAINYISAAYNAHDSLFLPVVVLVFNFTLGVVVQEYLQFVDNVLFNQIEMHALSEFNQVLAQAPTKNYLTPSYMEEVRAGRTALQEESLSRSYHAVKRIIASAVSSVTLCWALWNVSHVVALVAVFAPVPVIINYFIRTRKTDQAWTSISEARRQANYFANQLAYQRTGIELASLSGAGLIADKHQEFNDSYVRQARDLEMFIRLLELCTGLITVGIFATCVYLLSSEVSLALIVAAIAGLTSYINTLRYLGNYLSTLATSLIPNTNLRKFLAIPPSLKTRAALPAQVDSLQFQDVTVNYGEFRAVDHANLELRRNGFTALVGLNGCGKTSFIKAIMGTQPQVSGTVTMGNLTQNLAAVDYNLSYAAVQQEYGRYEVPLRDYLSLGLGYTPSEEQLWDALEKVLLADFVRGLPQGLDSLLGDQWEGGVNVSGGQWQRFAVARSFLTHESLVYLDEPTSAIDAPTEEVIFEHLDAVGRERFVLVTTHRVSTLKNAGCIYVMRAGQIVEQGTFIELNRPGTYFYELFTAQLIA